MGEVPLEELWKHRSAPLVLCAAAAIAAEESGQVEYAPEGPLNVTPSSPSSSFSTLLKAQGRRPASSAYLLLLVLFWRKHEKVRQVDIPL